MHDDSSYASEMLLLSLLLLFLIIKVYFSRSFYQIYVLIPKQYATFPAWMSWLIFLPVVSYVLNECHFHLY